MSKSITVINRNVIVYYYFVRCRFHPVKNYYAKTSQNQNETVLS